MSVSSFEENMKKLTKRLEEHITDKNGESILKGFIDSKGNIYPLTLDTKVLSKVIEFVFMPVIKKFCIEVNYSLKEPAAQNYYPDLTIIDNKTGDKYAIDIKTTYRINEKEFKHFDEKYLLKLYNKRFRVFKKDNEELIEIKSGEIINCYIDHKDNFMKKVQTIYKDIIDKKAVNGMTLGAYTGYFKDRESKKNIVYPYSQYKKHYILGMIYSREENDEVKIEKIENYKSINSPIYDIKIFFIEKYKIAITRAGSGNTKNIGSVKTEDALINGKGEFSTVEKFDEFWLKKE